jgi:hypothetical protein
MATTFKELAAAADFSAVEPAERPIRDDPTPEHEEVAIANDAEAEPLIVRRRVPNLGGLVYTIQIQLPESRDPAVYDALFRSLKTHLFNE